MTTEIITPNKLLNDLQTFNNLCVPNTFMYKECVKSKTFELGVFCLQNLKYNGAAFCMALQHSEYKEQEDKDDSIEWITTNNVVEID